MEPWFRFHLLLISGPGYASRSCPLGFQTACRLPSVRLGDDHASSDVGRGWQRWQWRSATASSRAAASGQWPGHGWDDAGLTPNSIFSVNLFVKKIIICSGAYQRLSLFNHLLFSFFPSNNPLVSVSYIALELQRNEDALSCVSRRSPGHKQ